MTETGKALLIVGGVAAGAYIVAKVAFAPKPAAAAQSASAGSFLDVGGLLNSFAGIFGHSGTGSSTSIGPSPQEVRALDYTNTSAYDAQGTADRPVYGVAGLDY